MIVSQPILREEVDDDSAIKSVYRGGIVFAPWSDDRWSRGLAEPGAIAFRLRWPTSAVIPWASYPVAAIVKH